MGVHGGSGGKESSCNAGDPSSIPGSERSSGARNGCHLIILAWKILCIEEPGQLQSIDGVTELAMTEQLTLSLSFDVKAQFSKTFIISK